MPPSVRISNMLPTTKESQSIQRDATVFNFPEPENLSGQAAMRYRAQKRSKKQTELEATEPQSKTVCLTTSNSDAADLKL